MTTPPTTVGGPLYHTTVDNFRRVLAAEADGFHKTMEPYSKKVNGACLARRAGQPHEAPTRAEQDAYLGCLMAGSYGYTLAAVLAVAAEFGPEVQQRLACVADDILINGDDHDRNADVMPAEPVKEGTPR